jgi:outer membrane protein
MILKRALLAVLLTAAVVVGGNVTSVLAADMPVKAMIVAPKASSPWMIRLRALVVNPSNSVTFDQLPGTGATWNTSVVPELDISYFFTPNIAAELILGVTRHQATGKDVATSGALAGTNLNGLNVGRSWLLPPTLLLQYHFTNLGAFKPYVGAGVNYTVFFNQQPGNVANNGVTITGLHFHNTFGAAVQAGFDYMIDRHWGVNFDVKKLYLRPNFDADANTGAIPLTGSAKLDPWLIGVGVSYRL